MTPTPTNDYLDNEKYVEDFVEKLGEEAKKKPDDLKAVVELGDKISKNTTFHNLDEVLKEVGKAKAFEALGEILKFDARTVLEGTATKELGIKAIIGTLIEKVHIKRFMEILLMRAMTKRSSNSSANYATKPVNTVFDATFNSGTPDGDNEVLFFDLLRVYIFEGSDYATDNPVHLGASSGFSKDGVKDAIQHRGKRTISEVTERAIHTFSNTPLFGKVPLALMAFGAFALGGKSASGMSAPAATASDGAEAATATGESPSLKEVGAFANQLSNTMGKRFGEAKAPAIKNDMGQGGGSTRGGRRTRRRRRASGRKSRRRVRFDVPRRRSSPARRAP